MKQAETPYCSKRVLTSAIKDKSTRRSGKNSSKSSAWGKNSKSLMPLTYLMDTSADTNGQKENLVKKERMQLEQTLRHRARNLSRVVASHHRKAQSPRLMMNYSWITRDANLHGWLTTTIKMMSLKVKKDSKTLWCKSPSCKTLWCKTPSWKPPS